MNAIDEMSALNRDLKKFFDEHGAAYPVWQALETDCLLYTSVSSEATFSAASMDETGTHTVVDHGGNEVEVPNKITRVVIDQIPILSTYMAYFEGNAPYIVGYCGSFKSVISDTVLKNIAPELMESSDTVYAQSDLNIEEIMKLNPDVILYNAGNSSHAEILKASGIPSIGFATVGASTEADPLERYEEWLKLLEDVFGEPGKTEAFVAAGDEIVTDVEARIADIPESDRPSALILWKYSDGVPQVSGNGTFGTYWMKHLGVTDKALEATGFAQTSMEQVYSWDPDILFLDGPGLQPLRTEDVLSGNVDGADFSTLTAVKSGRVYNTTVSYTHLLHRLRAGVRHPAGAGLSDPRRKAEDRPAVRQGCRLHRRSCQGCRPAQQLQCHRSAAGQEAGQTVGPAGSFRFFRCRLYG